MRATFSLIIDCFDHLTVSNNSLTIGRGLQFYLDTKNFFCHTVRHTQQNGCVIMDVFFVVDVTLIFVASIHHMCV